MLPGKEEKVNCDMNLAKKACDRREQFGYLPIDSQYFQRWIHSVLEAPVYQTYKSMAVIIGRFYKEDVFDIMDGGPYIQIESSMECLRMLLDMYYAEA